jgi:hypothetical protein
MLHQLLTTRQKHSEVRSLESKSGVIGAVKEIVANWENKSPNRVEKIRSDNGG